MAFIGPKWQRCEGPTIEAVRQGSFFWLFDFVDENMWNCATPTRRNLHWPLSIQRYPLLFPLGTLQTQSVFAYFSGSRSWWGLDPIFSVFSSPSPSQTSDFCTKRPFWNHVNTKKKWCGPNGYIMNGLPPSKFWIGSAVALCNLFSYWRQFLTSPTRRTKKRPPRVFKQNPHHCASAFRPNDGF